MNEGATGDCYEDIMQYDANYAALLNGMNDTVFDSLRAMDLLGVNQTGMPDSVYMIRNPLSPIDLSPEDSGPAIYPRFGSIFQHATDMAEPWRDASPAPPDCCDKKGGMLSMLLRCLVPCYPSKK